MEYFRSRRARAAAWTANDQVLDRGEIGFETDTGRAKIGNGVTPWSGLSYMDEATAAASEERIEYGSMRLATLWSTPTAGRIFNGMVQRQAAHVFDNYATTYSKCSWDIVEVGGPGNWTGLQFDTVNDLYAFLDANCVHRAGVPTEYEYNVMGTLYDTVDPTIAPINKMWGMNTLYSMLKGKRGYRKGSQYYVNDAGINWSSFHAWFAALCTKDVGFPLTAVWATDREKALWLPRTQRLLYGMPQPGFGMQTATGGRWVYNTGTLTWEAAPTPAYYVQELTPATGPVILWAFLNVTSPASYIFENSAIRALQQLEKNEQTAVCIHRVQNSSNNNQKSLYIKPVGIDRVGLSWVDETKYDLFAMYENFDFSRRIRPVTTSMKNQAQDITWVEKPAWFPGGKPMFSYKQTGQEIPRVRFFLRDKVTLRVSALSAMSIYPEMGQRNAPIKWLVQKV